MNALPEDQNLRNGDPREDTGLAPPRKSSMHKVVFTQDIAVDRDGSELLFAESIEPYFPENARAEKLSLDEGNLRENDEIDITVSSRSESDTVKPHDMIPTYGKHVFAPEEYVCKPDFSSMVPELSSISRQSVAQGSTNRTDKQLPIPDLYFGEQRTVDLSSYEHEYDQKNKFEAMGKQNLGFHQEFSVSDSIDLSGLSPQVLF